MTVLVCLGLMAGPSLPATERWFLMSRHGDCVGVSSLKRKVPELPDNIDPQSFAVFMRQRGYSVTSTRTSVPVGRAYEVRVPQKDLFLRSAER